MTRRIFPTFIAAAIIATVVLAPATLSFAEEEGSGTEVTETTVGFEPGTEPAVVIPEPAPVEDDPAWTFRYLVPSLLVLTGLAIAGLFVWYGLGIKGRYRVAR